MAARYSARPCLPERMPNGTLQTGPAIVTLEYDPDAPRGRDTGGSAGRCVRAQPACGLKAVGRLPAAASAHPTTGPAARAAWPAPQTAEEPEIDILSLDKQGSLDGQDGGGNPQTCGPGPQEVVQRGGRVTFAERATCRVRATIGSRIIVAECRIEVRDLTAFRRARRRPSWDNHGHR